MSSPKQPLGVTFVERANADATGIYEAADGIEAFQADEPYLLSDGKTMQTPLPVFDAGGPIFIDAMGNAQTALAVIPVLT